MPLADHLQEHSSCSIAISMSSAYVFNNDCLEELYMEMRGYKEHDGQLSQTSSLSFSESNTASLHFLLPRPFDFIP